MKQNNMDIKLPKLNLPQYNFQYKNEGKLSIYDVFRKKYIVLTPEEWVRQNFLQYILSLNYPKSRLKLEYSIKIGNISKRCDAIFFNKMGLPEILFEFKADKIKLDKSILIQSGVYNSSLDVRYIVLSNGKEHVFLEKNKSNDEFEFIKVFPKYLK